MWTRRGCLKDSKYFWDETVPNTFFKDLEVSKDQKTVYWNYQRDPFVHLVLNEPQISIGLRLQTTL